MTDVKEVRIDGYADPVFFCKFFLPHLFPGPVPWVHRGLLAILTGRHEFLGKYGEVGKIISNFVWKDEDETLHHIFSVDSEGLVGMALRKYTLIMLPRGFAKTTIAGIAVPLYKLLYQDEFFTAYISHAAPHAKMQLTNIKRELSDNRRIVACFGNLKPGLKDDEKWSEDFFETTTGVAVVARGRGGQVRGLNHRGRRPGTIIVDDVEDKESVNTNEQREKTRDWAYGDLIPALPEVGNQGTIVALGTLLHQDSLLKTWERDPAWTTVRMGAVDRQKELLWEENLDEEKLLEKKLSFQRAGMLHTFYMEYYNESVAPEEQLFRQEYFVYSPPENIQHHAIYIDPAISEKRTADETVIIVCGMSAKGRIWIVDAWAARTSNERLKVDKYFELAKLYKCDRHGVESNSYQAALVHLLREEMFRKKYYFEVEAITHKTKKVERIRAILQPRYASGYIHHARRFPFLESQLMDLRIDGSHGHDDWPDAVAGCVALLDPYAAHAAGDVDLGDDEYEPLDKVMGGEWRQF